MLTINGLDMNVMRYLKGKITLGYEPWAKWCRFGIDKYWSGRLIYISFSKVSLHLDCRINWMEDIKTGKTK